MHHYRDWRSRAAGTRLLGPGDPSGIAIQSSEVIVPAGGVPRRHRQAAVSRSVNIMRLELILWAVDVSKSLERIRAQGEAEARAIGRMHHAVRTNVEWLVKELPHHRHPALAYLKDVAIGGGHRDVNACGE